MYDLEENKDFIISEYKKGRMTQEEIAKALGVSPSTLNSYVKSINITKKRKSVWTIEKEDWLIENHNLPYSKLREHLHLDGETIRLKLLELGITRTSKNTFSKINKNDEELMGDIANPYMTAPEIVEKYKDKYGFSDSAIHHFRKSLRIIAQQAGIAVSSKLERRVAKALEGLGIVYEQELKLGRYSFDFHIGFKVLIEVQGYYHKKASISKRDKEKKLYAESLGYTVIYIEDGDIDEAESIIYNSLRSLGFPVRRLTENNLVNAECGVTFK